MKRIALLALLAIVTLPTWCSPALAQGVLIIQESGRRPPAPLPRPFIRTTTPPTTSYKVKSIEMSAKVVDQTAKVQLTQTFVNTGSRQMQVSFVFPVPPAAVIDQMTFQVGNKEYEAKVMTAKQARSIFEGYVRRNQDPALLEWAGQGVVKTSVFPVPPGAERKVVLRYSQVLERNDRLTEISFPLSTAKFTSKPIEQLSVRVSIESTSKIKNVYSPSHDVAVERRDNKHATIKFTASNVVPTNDFQLFFDASKKNVGASLITYRPNTDEASEDEDGYFLLMASPDVERAKGEVARKTIVFVVDRSGSMSGKKIEQARESLKFVLNNLNEGDLFNIVAYDSSVEAFREELQKFNDETRQEALAFVDDIYSGGSTNINGALSVALGMLQNKKLPNYVIFLTDGRPTAGEKNEMKIATNAKKANQVGARILNMGVGFDVNSRLLDRIANQNSGISQYVTPNEDLEEHVSRLYGRISRPVLTNVTIAVDVEGHDGKVVNRVYPREVSDIFAGGQLVITGRYKHAGDAKIVIHGQVGEKKVSYDFPGKLAKSSRGDNYSFVQKIWATRRIGEIIDELDLNGQNQELVEELVALSIKHGILTPYTSFLADENSPQGVASNFGRAAAVNEARVQLSRLSAVNGAAANRQRVIKQAYKSAPAADAFGTAPGGGQSDLGGAARGFGGGGRAGGYFRPESKDDESNTKSQVARRNLSLRGVQGATVIDMEDGTVALTDQVIQIGKETLYRRGKKMWVTAATREFDLAKNRAKVTDVERFSKAYFELIKENTKSENAILAQQQKDEELLLALRGKVYLFK
jgi:Ca-activated chloride channel family protein